MFLFYRLLHLYSYMVRRNVARFTSAYLPKSILTVRELCKPTYKIIRLETSVINVMTMEMLFPISRNRDIT
jgi:hypothetical protein